MPLFERIFFLDKRNLEKKDEKERAKGKIDQKMVDSACGVIFQSSACGVKLHKNVIHEDERSQITESG